MADLQPGSAQARAAVPQCCNHSLKLWLYQHSTNICHAQPRLTLPEDLPIPDKCCSFCKENLNGRLHWPPWHIAGIYNLPLKPFQKVSVRAFKDQQILLEHMPLLLHKFIRTFQVLISWVKHVIFSSERSLNFLKTSDNEIVAININNF